MICAYSQIVWDILTMLTGKKIQFSTRIFENNILAASDLLDMFTVQPMLNRAMNHNDPLWPTMIQNIYAITHYDRKLGKLFYNDPK